jgi:hypothetical protein
MGQWATHRTKIKVVVAERSRDREKKGKRIPFNHPKACVFTSPIQFFGQTIEIDSLKRGADR